MTVLETLLQRTRRWLLPALFSVVVAVAAAPADARYASLVIDAETGAVLHAVNATTRNYPASLTKMMTLLLLFESLERGDIKLSTPITFSRRAARQPASKLGLRAGESLTVKDAMMALILKSANDVAVAVAEKLARSEREFALQMTARARELGMSRTTFRNASGLPHRAQMSTAQDMATLARYLIYKKPEYYRYFAIESYKFRDQTFTSHNNLLKSFTGTDGLKTGYIRASGFNLVASVERQGRRLIGVVLGGRTARTRDQHMASLLSAAFNTLGTGPVLAGVAPPPLPDERPGPAQHEVAAAPVGAVERDSGGLFMPAETAPPADAMADVQEAALSTPVVGAGDAVAGPDVTPTVRKNADWGVQVGAYRSKHPAKEVAERAQTVAPSHLEFGNIQIVPLEKPNRSRLYRARITGLTKSEAYAACTTLRQARMHCMELRQTGDANSVTAVN